VDCGITDRAKLYSNQASAGDESNEPGPSDAGQTKFGITVQALPQQVQNRLHVTGGVMVTGVKPGSFADTINLFQNAVIVEINRKPITDVASYNAIASQLKSGDDVVFVVRDPSHPNLGTSLIGGTLP
jgi:serine protease Do